MRNIAHLFTRRNTGRKLILLAVVLVVCYVFGLIDHLFVQSFDELRWPLPTSLLRSEAENLYKGKSPSVPYVNDPDETFRFRMRPECPFDDKSKKQTLLVLIKSSVHHVKNREAIRKTWCSYEDLSMAFRCIFVIGMFTSSKIDLSMGPAVGREQDEFNDLLVLDFVDSYRNNTLKFIHSIAYARDPGAECRGPDFTFLVDDDYLVNLPELAKMVSKKEPTKELYEGWRFDSSPFRMKFHKHAVSLSEYPYDRYPPYITAGAVLLSMNTVHRFYFASLVVKLYPYDDVYAGLLAHILGIKARHNPSFVFWHERATEEAWSSGEVLAVHGYSPEMIIKDFAYLP